ncbi:hypothetical protein AFEL58S_02336 [Afipia felis]
MRSTEMSTETPLSVCIITHNQADYIEESVLSVINQKTSFDFEILIGEDCSTDQTAGILRRLQERFPGRLNVIYRDKNIGAPRNFEETLKACRGEFVAFLEGDDFWTDSNKLEAQVAYLRQHHDASFCYHRVRSLNLNTTPIEHTYPPEDPPAETIFEFVFQEYNPIHITSVVARRRLLDGLHEWRRGLHIGDWPIALFLTTVGYGGFIPAEMSRYRVHSGGTWTKLPDCIRLIYIFQMYLRLSKQLPQHEKALVDMRIARDSKWLATAMVDHAEEICRVVKQLEDFELSTFLLSCALQEAKRQEPPPNSPLQENPDRTGPDGLVSSLRRWLGQRAN